MSALGQALLPESEHKPFKGDLLKDGKAFDLESLIVESRVSELPVVDESSGLDESNNDSIVKDAVRVEGSTIFVSEQSFLNLKKHVKKWSLASFGVAVGSALFATGIIACMGANPDVGEWLTALAGFGFIMTLPVFGTGLIMSCVSLFNAIEDNYSNKGLEALLNSMHYPFYAKAYKSPGKEVSHSFDEDHHTLPNCTVKMTYNKETREFSIDVARETKHAVAPEKKSRKELANEFLDQMAA